MIDLIKVSKTIDYFALIVFVFAMFILWHFFSVNKTSDYIALIAVYVAIYLHILSARANETRFKVIQDKELELERSNNERYILSQRMRLIDLITSLRTQSDTNNFHLKYLLTRHGEKMEADQRDALEKTLTKATQDDSEFEGYFDNYTDLSNNYDIERITQDIAYITSALAEAVSTSKIIETGFKSYEST